MSVMTMTSVIIVACLAVGVALVWDWSVKKMAEDRARERKERVSLGSPTLLGMSDTARAAVLDEMSPPQTGRESVHHHPCHTWVRRTGARTAQVGLDEVTAAFAGRVERLELPSPGDMLRRDQRALGLVGRGRTLSLVAPVGGRVLVVNRELDGNPGLLVESPYDDGWCFTIESDSLDDDLRRLYPGAMAREWQELSRKRVTQLLAPALDPVAQTAFDGGELAEGFGNSLSDSQWQVAQSELFRLP